MNVYVSLTKEKRKVKERSLACAVVSYAHMCEVRVRVCETDCLFIQMYHVRNKSFRLGCATRVD